VNIDIYDTLERRIEKVDAITDTTTRYYYDDQRVVLRTQISGGVELDVRYYVFGNYIDEVLVSVIPAQAPNQDLYYAHDHLYSPAIMFMPNGTVAERCEYDAYGKVQVLSSDFLVLSSSQHGNPYAFTGRELDTLDADSLRLMYYRARTYDLETGRFMQRDPHGINPAGGEINAFSFENQYVDGLNIYQYAVSNPLYGGDAFGLWGSTVHMEYTTRWARGGAVAFKPEAARLIGQYNNAADSGETGPWPTGIPLIGGDPAYHFNVNNRSVADSTGGDSRLELSRIHLNAAKRFCLPKNDLPYESAKQLGMSLHPLQDWVAHADHGILEVIDLYYPHNGKSKQPPIYGPVSGYPDDINLDAKGSADGRAVKSVLKFLPSTGGRQSDYATYEPGNKRSSLTRTLTQDALLDFRGFLFRRGGCECKRFYLRGH